MSDPSEGTAWPTRDAWLTAFRADEEQCPWPGPRPLDRGDEAEHVLVGRTDDITEFLSHVELHRLIQLTGVSGVGKSSLLAVGLIPALSDRYTVVTCRDWNLRPGQRFDEYLAEKLHQSLPDDLRSRFSATTDLYWDLADLADRAVIVLDQFEEMLRQESESQEDALDFIGALLTDTACKVVLSYRTEYATHLRDLERRSQGQWKQSHYELPPIADSAGLEIVTTARKSTGVDIDSVLTPEAAEIIDALWRAARLTTSRAEIMVGPLHLQALLFALWHGARQRRIDADDVRQRLATVRAEGLDLDREPQEAAGLIAAWNDNETALEQVTTSSELDELSQVRAALRARLSAYRELMDYALQESAMARLEMAEKAAVSIEMDEYLSSGIASRLISIVPHLSSGTYKLDRQLDDLAEMGLDDQIKAVALALGGPHERERVQSFVGSLVSDSRLRELVQSSPRGRVIAETAALLGVTADDARQLTQKASELGCGPMTDTGALEVLMEELRRFAWAVSWLHDLNIARTKESQAGQASISLIHDGFGPAMVHWRDRFRAEHGTWVLRALTSPQGQEHEWGERFRQAEDALYQEQLSGVPGQPVVHVNIGMRGNSVLFGVVRHAVFVNCDFRGTLFLECVFEGVTFLNCSLDGALFSDCVVVGGTERIGPRSKPVEEQPHYVLGDADGAHAVGDLAALLARYRERDESGGEILVPAPEEAARPVDETDDLLAFTPREGGLTIEGGRVSALTLRGTRFLGEATVLFRRVRGSGVDVAELSPAGAGGSTPEFEFSECALRHVAFSTSDREQVEPSLGVSVLDSAIAQWWVGSDLVGTVKVQESSVGQLWVESERVTANLSESSAVGLVRVDVENAGTFSWPDGMSVNGARSATEAAETKFRDRVRRMDYRRE